MRFLPLILRNLLRKKRRTLLTVGSVVFPVFLVAFMATFLRTLGFSRARIVGLIVGEVLALAAGVALIVGVFSAIVPAVRAAWRPIVDRLRAA